MWIEFSEDVGTFKKGQRIDKSDEAAQTLIEIGKAAKCEAPKTNADEVKPLVHEVVKTAVAESLAEFRKELEPVTKRFKDTGYELGTEPKTTIPANVMRWAPTTFRSFTGKDAPEKAYRFGVWCLANYARSARDPEQHERMVRYPKLAKSLNISMNWLNDDDTDGAVGVTKAVGGEIVTKAASNENNNASSGFLVPDEFENDMIALKEKYGVFRREAKRITMTSDTRSDPRRRGGITPFFVSEDQGGTQSTKNWDRVRLTAKKLMVLTKYSNELNEDAVINIGDDLADEIAYAFANKEDLCGFLGDGTSTYGGIVGVEKAFLAVDSTIANILGVTVQTGNGAYTGIVLGDFNKVVGTLPEYADPNAKWYCSKSIWGNTLQRLAMAAGGNRVSDIVDGARVKEFTGYEVVISQVMRKTWAANQLIAIHGDLSRAARFGDRRQTTIAISDVALNSFEQDEIAIRGTERFDIVVHDVGESSAGTQRDPIQGLMAGPIVALFTAAS